MTPRIYCLGPLVLDRVLEVDRLPGHDEKAFVLTKHESPGGPPRNAAAALAGWGEAVSLVSAVGDDQVGMALLSRLDDEGIASEATEVIPDLLTATTIVIVDGTGERAILIEPIPDTVLASIGRDLVPTGRDAVMANFFHPAAVERACGRARDAGALAVIDLELPEINRWGWDSAQEVAAMADVVNTNAQVMRDFAEREGHEPGIGAARALATRLAPAGERVCVTLGADGVVAREGGELVHVSVKPVAASDTTGAGDVFLAALVKAQLHGRSFALALRQASAAAELFLSREHADWLRVESRARALDVRALDKETAS